MQYRIREIREAQGIPQYQLAKKSGVSRATIWKLEKKEDQITTTETLNKIANALNVEPGELFLQD